MPPPLSPSISQVRKPLCMYGKIFRPGDWDREAGEYEAELEVVNPSTGFRQTVFELMRFKLREDLG